MIGSAPLAKARLLPLDDDGERVLDEPAPLSLQFNPETLKVAFANQLATSAGAGDQSGPAARQFVGAGTTKLALSLVFDVTQPQPEGENVDDVRRLTQKVAYYITPRRREGERDGGLLPPMLRFAWGSFQFDGLMDSLEETLDFWSPDGRPLRATLVIAMSQQRITAFAFGREGGQGGAAGSASRASTGARPLVEAGAGATLQGLADAAGRGADWARIAEANGIENPRRLALGSFVDLGATVPGRR